METSSIIAVISICVTVLLTLGAVVFHAGIMHNRVSQLRLDHDEEKEKNRRMRHDDFDRLSQEIAGLKMLLLKVIPKEEWPQNL